MAERCALLAVLQGESIPKLLAFAVLEGYRQQVTRHRFLGKVEPLASDGHAIFRIKACAAVLAKLPVSTAAAPGCEVSVLRGDGV
jgi:hypothetical protein